MALPGGTLAKRPLHFIWIADCSSSMSGAKIRSLNEGIREAVPGMRKVAADNPHVDVQVRALKFSTDVEWHIEQPVRVQDFSWQDLETETGTRLGAALSQVAEVLRMPPMEQRALPPVLVLVSDGKPTDDFEAGLRRLLGEPWGKRAVRIAIAIGKDAHHDNLRKFIADPEVELLEAFNAPTLVTMVHWVSTMVLKAVSSPMSQAHGASGVLPARPPAVGESLW